ncbi:MAG: NUDIX domain-containing protein [Candidatus Aenigmarchaeota archaeon]|nr:NUDIX domain-containing protein [Candidatus Aenigmarchaeota archaeon]
MEKVPRVGSAVLVEKDGKFLLGERNKKNAKGFWVIPGGKVEWGETIEQAAIREIKEETGLDIEIIKKIGSKEIINTPADYHRVVFFHLARPKNSDLKYNDDLSDAGFFTIDEIKNMKTVKSVEWVLRKAGYWKD